MAATFRPPADPTCTWRPSRGHLAVALLAVGLLAGCATGNADDSGPIATEEAKATNVISALEATNVVEQFFKPTPTPPPYPTRLPAVANIRMTTDVGDQNRPTNQCMTCSRSGPLYVAAEIADLHPGQTVVASFRDDNGNEFFSGSVAIGNDRELVWIAIQWDGAGSAPGGDYAAVVSVEGPGTNDEGEPATVRTEVGSIAFRIQ